MVATLCCSLLLALAAQENASLHLEVRRAADDQLLSANSVVYQGEVLFLDLEITFTEEFHNQQLINPWRMPLDVPVELQLPWAQENSQWQVIAATDLDGSSLVINRDKSLAKRIDNSDDGRIRYLVHREIRLTSDQAFEVPVATMAVVWATRFEDDLARGMVPLDRQEAVISSKAMTLEAIPIPTQGQPASYRGAVGKFEMRLKSELREDLNWDITVHTGGRGWLEKDMLASLDSLSGFHVRGQRIEKASDGMLLIAELSATDSALLPTLPSWSYFDPSTPAAYVTLGPATALNAEVNETNDSIEAGASADDVGELALDESSNLQLYWIGAVGALFVFGVLHLLRRGSKPAMPQHPISKPTPRQKIATHASPVPAVRVPADFVQKLADHFGCKREEVYTEAFADYLTSAKVSASLREQIQAAVASIVKARFGGLGVIPAAQELETILCELKA